MPGERFPDDTSGGVAGVEIAVFDGEAVLFDVAASMVHRLNAVAAAVWLLCDGETTSHRSDELAGVFGVTGRRPRRARHALDGLAAAGLLVGQAGAPYLPPEPTSPPTAPRSSLPLPTLEVRPTTAPCGRAP